jgi:hypothetical protein
MILGRKDFFVTRTDSGADVFRLARFFRDDDLLRPTPLIGLADAPSAISRTRSIGDHIYVDMIARQSHDHEPDLFVLPDSKIGRIRDHRTNSGLIPATDVMASIISQACFFCV